MHFSKSAYYLLVTIFAISPSSVVGQTVQESADAVSQTDFKIETEVTVGESTTPVSFNQTLFTDKLVFDFRFRSPEKTDVSEVTIFDSRNRSFVLMDMNRKIHLKIENLQLLRIREGMKNELKQSDTMTYLLFEDHEEDFQLDAGTISVSSEFITYLAKGSRPDNDTVLSRYLMFLEHYTLLGATDPRRLPPFARIELNNSIKKYGLVPSNVTLTVRKTVHNKNAFTASSKHKLSMTLNDHDLEQIADARRNWASFRRVELGEYRDLTVTASAESAEKR